MIKPTIELEFRGSQHDTRQLAGENGVMEEVRISTYRMEGEDGTPVGVQYWQRKGRVVNLPPEFPKGTRVTLEVESWTVDKGVVSARGAISVTESGKRVKV